MKVELVESELVLPSEETPKHTLWLSNLDIIVAYIQHAPIIFVYRRPNGGDADSFNGHEIVGTLKAALSRALVPFYPLAGRLDNGRDGRLQINCNAEGVLFVVARSESSIAELGDFSPTPEMRRLFVPPSVSAGTPPMLLMAQVTVFKGGEVILGTAFHHIAGDGFVMMNFVKAWADTARGVVAQPAAPPFLDRSLLRARSPPTVLFDHVEYNPHSYSPPVTSPPTITSVLKLTKSQLELLKNGEISTYQATAAHLWRCLCIARRLAPEQHTRLYFPANARGRLRPPLPDAYFGNAICRTSAVARAGDITSNPLGFAAQKIRDATVRVNDEYVRSVIDFLEVREKRGPQALRGTDVVAVSWLGMPGHDADFGWGRPEFVRKASMSVGGYMYLTRSPEDDGGVCIVLAVEEENMERFKRVFYEELDGMGRV